MNYHHKETQGVHNSHILHCNKRMFIMDYAVPDETNETTTSPSTYSLQYNSSLNLMHLTTVAEFIADCNKNGPLSLRIAIESLVFVLALPANAILLWLLVKHRKTLSPSEVLGLNFALLGVLYCLGLPLDICITTMKNRSGLPLCISSAFATLSYFGCPLLLTSMCLERYVAVAHPVLFMRLGKWEYRAACSAIIWFLTCIMAAVIVVYTMANMAVLLSIIMNVLFLVMVACFLGIIWVLFKKGPGEGDQNSSVVKKRALKNVVAVLVLSTIVYFPMLALAPFLLLIQILTLKGINTLLCSCLTMLAVLPNFGVCIGPMFYVARLMKTFCRRNNKSGDTRVNTTIQRT